jgi:hypothetical protein
VKPKRSYSFGTTSGASQYEPILIHYTSAAERDAYVSFYRQRGIPLKPINERRAGGDVQGDLTMRAPRPTWLSNGSRKPAVLQRVIQLVATYPSYAEQAVMYAFQQGDPDADAYRGLIPRLLALARYGKLQQAIDDTRNANGGRLEMDDFRLWAMIFGPGQHYTALRADLCDDPNVATVRFKQ